MRRVATVLLLVGPALMAWILAFSGWLVYEGWLAIPFRDLAYPTVPAINLSPGVAPSDVVTSVGKAAQVVMASLLSALVVEISKFWLLVPTIQRRARLVPAAYVLFTAFQVLLVRDAMRYWHFHWWAWLLWQLRLGELPVLTLPANRFFAFLPSFALLLASTAVSVLHATRSSRSLVVPSRS